MHLDRLPIYKRRRNPALLRLLKKLVLRPSLEPIPQPEGDSGWDRRFVAIPCFSGGSSQRL